MSDHQEDLMRRFLLGDVTSEERERVERRFFEDGAFFEALCAMEDELIVAHLRDERPGLWRDRFAATISASPALQRRVAEMRVVRRTVEAMPPAEGVAASTPGRPAPGRRGWGIGLSLAAASIAGLAFAGWIALRQSPSPVRHTQAEPRPDVEAPIVTFVLFPGPTRSDGQQANTVRIPSGAREVRLQVTVDAGTATPIHARLRMVGGSAVALPGAVHAQQTPGGLELSLIVPAALLPRGDYLLTLEIDVPTGNREVSATRFFSVVE